jgi:hypothetical protein
VTSASDSAPRPRRRSNTPVSLSDSASNTCGTPRNGECAAARTFAERRSPRAVTLASLAGALALAWSIAVGWFYERSTRDIAMLAIPVLMAMLMDANDVVLEWSHSTFWPPGGAGAGLAKESQLGVRRHHDAVMHARSS